MVTIKFGARAFDHSLNLTVRYIKQTVDRDSEAVWHEPELHRLNLTTPQWSFACGSTWQQASA